VLYKQIARQHPGNVVAKAAVGRSNRSELAYGNGSLFVERHHPFAFRLARWDA
jgi:hypothetical protein